MEGAGWGVLCAGEEGGGVLCVESEAVMLWNGGEDMGKDVGWMRSIMRKKIPGYQRELFFF